MHTEVGPEGFAYSHTYSLILVFNLKSEKKTILEWVPMYFAISLRQQEMIDFFYALEIDVYNIIVIF